MKDRWISEGFTGREGNMSGFNLMVALRVSLRASPTSPGFILWTPWKSVRGFCILPNRRWRDISEVRRAWKSLGLTSWHQILWQFVLVETLKSGTNRQTGFSSARVTTNTCQYLLSECFMSFIWSSVFSFLVLAGRLEHPVSQSVCGESIRSSSHSGDDASRLPQGEVLHLCEC